MTGSVKENIPSPSQSLDEHERLLSYLVEYSGKLKAVSGDYYKKKYVYDIQGICIIFVMLVIGLGAVFLNSYIYAQFDHKSEIPVSILLFGGVFGLPWMIFIAWFLRGINERRHLRYFEIEPARLALKRLLVRASKLETHSISDYDAKIIFNLRLSEAESALAFSDWVVSDRSSLFSIFAPSRVPSSNTAASKL